MFLLITGLLVPACMLPAIHAQPSSNPLISVDRSTVIYPNYAVSTDTIKVINGSLSSIIAKFPTNTTILSVGGPDVLYAYRLSSSPTTSEVVVFKNELVAGSTTQIVYVYTGFLNSGELQIPFQAGYSVTSVNDSSTYYYGVQGWGPTLQVFYKNHYLNISQGETFTFNGTTKPNSFATASNPPTTTMPTSYQAYIQTLNRQIDYSGGVFHIEDQAVFVWASSNNGNRLYLLLPNNVVNKSISVSYFYGNVSSTLKYDAYPGYSLLIVDSPVELGLGQKVGLQLAYEIKAQQLNISTVGLYAMFCQACSVTVGGVKPVSGNWTSMGSDYFAAFRDATAKQLAGFVVGGTSSSSLISGASLAVFIVGVFAAASSYTYTQTRNRRRVKRAVPQTIVKSLTNALATIDTSYNTIKKFLEGGVKVSVATTALASFDELQRRLSKEVTDSAARGEISQDAARRLVESLREIRDSFSDLIEIQTQFNQKKIRQNVYIDLKAKYQKNLQRALSAFKETVNDIASA